MVASREALRDRGYAERGSTVVHSSTLRLCTAPRACIPNLIAPLAAPYLKNGLCYTHETWAILVAASIPPIVCVRCPPISQRLRL